MTPKEHTPIMSTSTRRQALTIPCVADRPTLDIPEAGAILGMGRVRSYEAARAGSIPTIPLGPRRHKVPTAALRTMLGLDPNGPAVELNTDSPEAVPA